MLTESFFIDQITHELLKSLGNNYSIEIPSDFSDLNPDIIVRNIQTGETSIIELKGSSPNEELPYAVIPSLRKLRTNPNIEKLDKIILVSLSNVSNTVRKYLQKDNI